MSILDQLNTKCFAWGAYQLIAKNQVVNLKMKAIAVPWKTEWKIIRALTAASFEYNVDAWGVYGLPLWSTGPRTYTLCISAHVWQIPTTPAYVAMRRHSTIQLLPYCWWTLKYNRYNTTDEQKNNDRYGGFWTIFLIFINPRFNEVE